MEIEREKETNALETRSPGSYMTFSEDNTYHANTWAYQKIYQENWDLIEKHLLERIWHKLRKGETDNFVIADFGTADGQMVMPTLKQIIKTIREHLGSDIEIEIIFEDQKRNNYNVLMQNMQDFMKDCGPIICLSSSTTMFKQCVLKNSVDFSFSVVALHWLSKCPSPISNGMVYSDGTPQEKALLKQQSHDDFCTFMTLRLRELKPGGRMFICCPYKNEEDSFETTCYDDSITQALKLLKERQIITGEEFLNIAVYLVSRTKQDFEDAFQKCKENGLTFCIEDIRFVKRKLNQSPKEIKTDQTLNVDPGECLLGLLRTVFYSSVYEGLSLVRSQEQKQEICNHYFNLLMDIVPEKSCSYILNTADFFVFKQF